MGWKKLNDCVEYWEEPVIGALNLEGGMRYMALCRDPASKNPYRGIARQVYERKGSQDMPGYVDRSKLVLVESGDLLKWKVVGDLKIKDMEKIVKKLQPKDSYFIGLEDPDIITDESGRKHLYFTIAYKYKNKSGHKLFLGHAEGRSLEERDGDSRQVAHQVLPGGTPGRSARG